MKIAGVIPARYGSSRFPGKPLATIDGISMIERVYRQVLKAKKVDIAIVATDDQRIYDHVLAFGGTVLMTNPDHINGTERCAEVARMLGDKAQGVINIQGDEPFIDPKQIDQVAELIQEHTDSIATLVRPIDKPEKVTDPNTVKAVMNTQGQALYFSRSAIPYNRDDTDTAYYEHVGIYGFASSLLQQLVQLSPSPLELTEKLEQLRWMEHGHSIYTAITQHRSVSVDTPNDINAAELYLKEVR